MSFGPEPGQLQSLPQLLPAPLFPGEVANLQVRIWESAFGSTYESALASAPRFGRRAMTGKSAVLRMRNPGQCPGVVQPASLVQAGLQFLEGLAALVAPTDGTKNGQPAPSLASLVGTDARTGQPVLQIPMPSPEALQRGVSALQKILEGLAKPR